MEDFVKVVELTVDVTANSDRSGDILKVGLFNQDVFGFVAELLDHSLGGNLKVTEVLQYFIDVHLNKIENITLYRQSDTIIILSPTPYSMYLIIGNH